MRSITVTQCADLSFAFVIPPLIENMRVSEASIKLSCTTTLHGTFIFKDIAPPPLKIEQNSVIWEIVKLVVSITVGLGHCWAASPLSLSI